MIQTKKLVPKRGEDLSRFGKDISKALTVMTEIEHKTITGVNIHNCNRPSEMFAIVSYEENNESSEVTHG